MADSLLLEEVTSPRKREWSAKKNIYIYIYKGPYIKGYGSAASPPGALIWKIKYLVYNLIQTVNTKQII